MNATNERIADLLIAIISDGFNRSLGALREAGAVDCTEMLRAYRGVGSTYYDLVTKQIEYTARVAAPELRAQLGIASAPTDESCQDSSAK